MVSCSGSLVQSCCGEGGALQTDITALCGEHSRCSGHTGLAPARGRCVCFPSPHCSGSRLLSREQAPCCVHFPGLSRSDSGFRVFHKSADSVGPAFCAFPSPSSSGSQELDGHTLPWCRAPSPLRGPSLSFRARRWGAPCVSSGELDSSCDPPGGCRPSRISRKSLVRSWKPVCSLVGDAVSGAEFAPFPSPLPPASDGDGPVNRRLALLWSFSVRERLAVCSGQLIFSLSLAIPQFKFLYHEISL